jgi:hypothetical protein
MAEKGGDDFVGRKIFFLHPSAVIQNRIIGELVQQEYEVYLVKDQARLRQVLKKYPASIVFANINDGMPEKDWEAWIRGIMAGDSRTDIGILCSNDDESLKRKYLAQIKVRCGYTALKSDLAPAIQQLVEILRAVNAKGRRKYIRINTENENNVTVNLPLRGIFINGVIRDISVAGFSCAFTEDPELQKNSLFQDIQLRLQTQILKAEGIAFGSRTEGETKNYVIIFTQRIDPSVRVKIRNYIQQNLQSKMDLELAREKGA